MWIVIISYSAMFVYIGVAIGRFPSKISSGFTLAIIGIIIVSVMPAVIEFWRARRDAKAKSAAQ